MEFVGDKWVLGDDPLSFEGDQPPVLGRNSRPFAIGSCFARNINRWLEHQGIPVSPLSWGLHYNPNTILYEFRRASSQSVPEVTWAARNTRGELRYVDGLRHTIDEPTMGELRCRKSEIDSSVKRAFEVADFFLITLGLAEVWEIEQDCETIVINRAPHRSSSPPLKARNRLLSPFEVSESIDEIVRIIRTEHGSAVPIYITVSPVPLKQTSSGMHPHIANWKSKASLIMGLDMFLSTDFAQRKVTYFPSFEFFFSQLNAEELWQRDGRHPTSSAVEMVARAFVENHYLDRWEYAPGFSVPSI